MQTTTQAKQVSFPSVVRQVKACLTYSPAHLKYSIRVWSILTPFPYCSELGVDFRGPHHPRESNLLQVFVFLCCDDANRHQVLHELG